jgi:hypothetical protein
MVLTLALSLALATQEIPDKASLLYTGVPSCTSPCPVQMVTHDAKAVLSTATETVDSLSTFKNTSDAIQNITVSIPVEGHNVDYNMPNTIQVSATVDNVSTPVTMVGPKIVPPTDQRLIASGIKAGSYQNSYQLKLNFIGRGSHSLRVHFVSSIGKAGLDGAQRVISYDTSGGASWHDAIGQLNFGIKYTPRIVFQVYAALPEGGWQIGSTGAFVKQTNVHPTATSKFIFTYYPGGFDKLGG